MAEIKYGHREGPGKGKEYKVAADQYFHRRGGHFCYIDSAGEVNVATDINTASDLMGWAVVPKDTSGKNSWKSSSGDKVFVVTGLENKFEIPNDGSVASANATLIGKGAGITDTNATYTMVQKAVYKATTASCNLLIHDFDADNNTLLVSIRPGKYMIS